MDDISWQASLAHESRCKIVKRIMDTLQRHVPVGGQDGVDELLKIAWRFEEQMFQTATDQHDYFRKISLEMLAIETRANGNPRHHARPGAAQAALSPVESQVYDLAMQMAAQHLNDGTQLAREPSSAASSARTASATSAATSGTTPPG